MGKKFYLPFLFLIFLGAAAFAQTGEIKGHITEKGGKEGVAFASVAAMLNGAQVQATVTDFDGNFSIKPLNPGKYDVKVTCVGYSPAEIKGVIVSSDKTSFADLQLGKGVELGPIDIVEYSVPLIDKGSPATQKTVTREDIAAAPTRDVNSLVAQSAGVYQKDDGGDLNIRGSRSDATAYYIDGIKVRGDHNLPKSGQEQITVITGGLPAQYGDATGGVVSVTTRGPSKIFSGGVEAVTSQLFDDYGYNLVSGSLSGPIFTPRDSLGRKSGQAAAGFFVAAEYEYNKDGNPSAIPIYVVKKDLLDDVRAKPLVRAPSGLNYIHRSNFFHMSDLESQKFRPNVASNDVRLNGKLDFRPFKNVTFTLGGSASHHDGHDYIDIYQLMNYDNNPQSISTDWRVFGKITHRFASDTKEKSSSAVKNAFYTIQADYEHNSFLTQNSVHKDKIFNYGYVGKFTQSFRSFYFPTGDSIGGLPQLFLAGQADTSIDFVPGTQNPYTANYTQQYYDLTDPLGTPGYQDNFGDLSLNGALLNDDNRLGLNVYSLWATPGRVRTAYGKSDNTQVRITVSGSADIKSHNIIAGLEWEQRTERAYNVAPNAIWGLMRQLSYNDMLLQPDSNSFTNTSDGTYVYTDWKAAYQPTTNVLGEVAPGFYENIRHKLNLGMSDTVQTDALDPSFYSLDLFTPDELDGYVAYYGYDYLGHKSKTKPSAADYFTQKDANNNFVRPIDAFRPTYVAGYIQDRFTVNDLIFNVGLRIDRYAANQKVLKDKYLLYLAHTAGDQAVQTLAHGDIPASIKSDYVVYVNDYKNPTQILGYRKDDNWYDPNGDPITDLSTFLQSSGSSAGIQPWIINTNDYTFGTVNQGVFKDFQPQVNYMPRIAFSFPISDEAYFAAHYDLLTQRPQSEGLARFNPGNYDFLAKGGSGTVSNPDLKPERTTDYEIVFQQKLSKSSALSISAFYKELRDMIEIINVQYAFPQSYSTYGNVDFGTVKGLTFSYDLRRTENIRMNVSYTLQFAEGTGSDPNTSAGILAQQGQTNLREPKPLNYDQRHRLVTSFDYHYGSGKDYNGPVWWNRQVFSNMGLNAVMSFGSGTPYTRKSNITPTADFTTAANGRSVISGTLNGSRFPWQFRIDAKVNKTFEVKTGKKRDGSPRRSFSTEVYLQVLNVLDTRNVTSVYQATGSPSDDGYISSPGAQSAISGQVDPQAYIDLYRLAENNSGSYSLPRRIRLGVSIGF